MYVVETPPKTYKAYKAKKHKLNKKGPSIIGRSTQVDVTLNEEDVLVSRHAFFTAFLFRKFLMAFSYDTHSN